MGRSAEFAEGRFRANPFVDARYGDKKQLPAPSERRAGPYPYPQTFHEHVESEEEKRWSQSDE